MTGVPATATRSAPVAVFLVLAFVCTWVLWVPRALSSTGVLDADLAVELAAVWAYGPALAAVVTAVLVGGRPALRELGGRLTRWRVGMRWWALVLAGPALAWAAVAAVHIALGGSVGDLGSSAGQAGPAASVLLLLALCLTDGLGEETGWRGWALPRLLERHGAVTASLLLGLVWAVWHAPLYWTGGAALHGAPVGLLLLHLPLLSVVHTWLFLRTGGSVLPAIVLHASVNLFGVPLPDGDARPFLLLLAVELVVVCVLAPRIQDPVSRPR